LILYLVNSELKVHEGELQQITQIYQLSLWIICVLYLLGVALLLFNRYWSWLPFVLGAASPGLYCPYLDGNGPKGSLLQDAVHLFLGQLGRLYSGPSPGRLPFLSGCLPLSGEGKG
jgi:hypothetical protein